MDVVRLWALMMEDSERQPLVTTGEARAVLALLQLLAEGGGDAGDAADELVQRLVRRLPAEG